MKIYFFSNVFMDRDAKLIHSFFEKIIKQIVVAFNKISHNKITLWYLAEQPKLSYKFMIIFYSIKTQFRV